MDYSLDKEKAINLVKEYIKNNIEIGKIYSTRNKWNEEEPFEVVRDDEGLTLESKWYTYRNITCQFPLNSLIKLKFKEVIKE